MPLRYSYEGDPDAAFEWFGRAKQELERLRVRMRAEGRVQGTFHLALSEDAYCYGHILPTGDEHVHIVVAPTDEAVGSAKFATLPDFLSGVVVGGRFRRTPTGTRIVGDLYPTPETSRLHYQELHVGAWTPVAIGRLAMSPWGAFWEFGAMGNTTTAHDYQGRMASFEFYANDMLPPYPFTPPWEVIDEARGGVALDLSGSFNEGIAVDLSQYQCIRGSMYSGRMRELVQTLLGFGRQTQDADGNEVSIYSSVIDDRDALFDKIAERRITGYDDTVKANGLQIRYDYRWFRTHGLCHGSDGTWWIVEISQQRGVVAIRLPLYDLTGDPDFRAKLEELGNEEAMRVVDLYGGFPNGQAFPNTAAQFAAFERAGKITRLATPADLHPFYRCSAYSQGLGWCFNDSGTEAHNTAYYYKDSSMPYPDVQIGVHYAIRLGIGGLRARPPSGVTKEIVDAFTVAWEPLRDKPEYEDLIDAAIYKLDWMSDAQFAELHGLSDEESLKKVDSFILPSELVGSASLSKAGEGYLFWPTWMGPQIKFPSYEAGILLSHDFRPAAKFYAGKTRPYCNTTMHVFFVGDELKYVKYYLNPNQVSDPASSFNTQEPCGFMGTWDYGSDSGGPLAVPAGFYTTDIDDREEGRPNRLKGTGSGSDLGYLQVGLTDRLEWPPEAFLFREKTWRIMQQWESVNGASTVTAIAIPFMDRCAYMHARFDRSSGRSSGYGSGNVAYQDPHVYRTWRNFGGYTRYEFIDGTWVPKGEHPAGCGIVTRRTVWYEEPSETYPSFMASDHSCDWMADSGPWAQVCQDAERMTYNIAPPPNVGGARSWGAEATLTLHLVCHNSPSPLLMKRQAAVDEQTAIFWEPKWFRPSPDKDGSAYYIHATENCMGDADAIVFMDDMISNLQKVQGAPNLPAMRVDIPAANGGPGVTFIGVID